MREYLIYTSAGLNSNVHLWAESDNRNYDIWITNYSEKNDHLREYADYYNESKGPKFLNFHKVLTENRDLIKSYKAIMMADDDMIISSAKLNNLFEMIKKDDDIWIVTPAFSRFGEVTHDTTARQLLSKYRLTNFAENTCPIFRTEKLISFMDVYDGSVKSYGIDWWYLNNLGLEDQRRIIISDENYCINPRDFRKKGGSREIDKIGSAEFRKDSWHRKREELGIGSFKKITLSTKYRSLFEVLIAAPIYLLENLVWISIEGKILSRLRGIAKKAINYIHGSKSQTESSL